MDSLSLDHLSHQLPRIGRGVNVLLLIVLVLIVVQMAWKAYQWRQNLEDLTVSLEQEQTPVMTQRPEPTIDYGQQVARLHLFGSVAASVPIIKRTVTESRLPLYLKGVFAGSEDGKQSYAIIQEQGKDQKLFKVGDEISAGVSLDSVFREYVLVERNGSLEKVSLPRATLKSAPLNPSIDVQQAPENDVQAEQESLTGVRNEILRSPKKLTQLISIAPYLQNDIFLGFQVAPAEDPQLFHQLGLQEGDIVTSINGVKLDSPGKSIDAIDELMAAKDINLTILRDDTTLSLVRSFD